MAEIKFLAGDIVLFRTEKNLISSLIRLFSTQPEDKNPTLFEHCGVMVSATEIVEAKTSVVKGFLTDYFAKKNIRLLVARLNVLTDDQRNTIAEKAESYIGRGYGWFKVAEHLGDYLLSKMRGKNVFFFRNIGKNDNYPICSWLDAHAYLAIDYRFLGLDADVVEPDDIGDDILEREPTAYTIIYSNMG